MTEANYKAISGVLQKLGARISSDVADGQLSISGIAYDSRQVKPGYGFFCIPGDHVDGNQFIAEAVKGGATLVVTERQPSEAGLPVAIVTDVRAALAAVAAEFYGHPSRKLRLLGVTGTNGKTTTTHLIERIFDHAGRKTGLIGTLGSRTKYDDAYTDAKHTTPQSADLQRMLSEMVTAGCVYASMEVSSHALAQKRVDQCEFASAVVTNITQDHLDFHKTMDHYWRAKRRLFEGIASGAKENRSAILNLDDPLYDEFVSVVGQGVKKLSYGWDPPADVHVISCDFAAAITQLKLGTPLGELQMRLRLTGRFNVYNVMAAVAVSLAEGIDLSSIAEPLENFAGVAGRFEVVSSGANKEPLCIVDYAHTPDGLDNVLKTAAHVAGTSGKLIVVFGCGGDRDASKRPQMGEIAETRANEVVVTSDNPRSEDPQQIIANILAGIRRMQHIKVEADRAAAIRMAVLGASEKDVVVIAGKGHENYQILADRTIPFDDRSEVLKALKERQAPNLVKN